MNKLIIAAILGSMVAGCAPEEEDADAYQNRIALQQDKELYATCKSMTAIKEDAVHAAYQQGSYSLEEQTVKDRGNAIEMCKFQFKTRALIYRKTGVLKEYPTMYSIEQALIIQHEKEKREKNGSP